MTRGLAQLSGAFAARSRRERAAMITAAVAMVLILGDTWLIKPEMRERRRLQLRLEQQQQDLVALRTQMQTLHDRHLDPDAGRKTQLEVTRNRLAQIDAEYTRLQRSMVAPDEMGGLIESLLRQHRGLQLVALRSLPVVPLRDGKAMAAAAAGAVTPAPTGAISVPADVPASGAGAGGREEAWLYLHGVQVTVQGGYADMQAYLQALEDLPRRLSWGALTIDADAWPASTMTVTLYTVNLDRTWWRV